MSRRARLCLPFVSVLVALLLAPAIGRAATTDAEVQRGLRGLVAAKGGPPGAIATLYRDGRLTTLSAGRSNIERRGAPTATQHMRIASIAKAFSGAVALSLVSEGKLSLDDTIGERLPNLPDRWSKVTLGQLLNHTSGIPDFSNSKGFKKALFASLKKAPPPEKLLTYVYDKDLLFKPGSKYHYSNSDNIAVALMVEAATGKSYERQLREQVYGPLGLTKTSLPSGPNLREPYIHGYDNDPSEQPPEDYSETIAAGWAWASGGIVSTPSDLNDFIRGYVGGKLFDKQTRAQQRRVREGGSSEPPGPGKNSAGKAIFRYETRCGTVWGHTGNTPGYTQFMAASRDGSRSVVVSVNEQLTPELGDPKAFEALRRTEGRAVCAALAGR